MKESLILPAVHVPPSNCEKFLNELKDLTDSSHINHPITTVTGPLDMGPITLEFHENIYPTLPGRSMPSFNAETDTSRFTPVSRGSFWSRVVSKFRGG